MNKVIMMGNLTRDVEIRDAANNTTVARAGIAVNRPFKKDEVDFFNLVAFNKTAEFLSKYFVKGSKILVEGYLRTSNYEDRDGNKKSSTEIIIEQIEFASSKRDSGGKAKSNAYREDDVPPLEDPPF